MATGNVLSSALVPVIRCGICLVASLEVASRRSEEGELAVVHLVEASDAAQGAPAPVHGACRVDRGRGDEAADFLKADIITEGGDEGVNGAGATDCAALDTSGSAGAFLCPTQRCVLVVTYDAGMDVEFARRVCVGTAEYIAEEGQ